MTYALPKGIEEDCLFSGILFFFKKLIKSIEEDNAEDFVHNANLFITPYVLLDKGKGGLIRWGDNEIYTRSYLAQVLKGVIGDKFRAIVPTDFKNGLPFLLHGEQFYWDTAGEIKAEDYLEYDEKQNKFTPHYNGKGKDNGFVARALKASDETCITPIEFLSTKINDDIADKIIDYKFQLRFCTFFSGRLKGFPTKLKANCRGEVVGEENNKLKKE